MQRENIENNYTKYSKLSDWGSKFGAICLIVSPRGPFFLATSFLKRLAVPHWTDVGLQCGTLGPILSIVISLCEPRSKFATKFKDSKATNGTHHTFKKASEASKNDPDNQTKQNSFTSIV